MRKQNTSIETLYKLMAREEWLSVRLRFFSRMNSPEPAPDSPLYKGYLRSSKWEIEREDIRMQIRDTDWDD